MYLRFIASIETRPYYLLKIYMRFLRFLPSTFLVHKTNPTPIFSWKWWNNRAILMPPHLSRPNFKPTYTMFSSASDHKSLSNSLWNIQKIWNFDVPLHPISVGMHNAKDIIYVERAQTLYTK